MATHSTLIGVRVNEGFHTFVCATSTLLYFHMKRG